VGDGDYTGQVLTLDTTLSLEGTSAAVIPQIVLTATANVTNAAATGVESAIVTVNADASLVQGYGLTASGGTTVMSGSFTGSTSVPASLTLAGSGSVAGSLTLGESSATVSPGAVGAPSGPTGASFPIAGPGVRRERGRRWMAGQLPEGFIPRSLPDQDRPVEILNGRLTAPRPGSRSPVVKPLR
jgi:hypothetical protein